MGKIEVIVIILIFILFIGSLIFSGYNSYKHDSERMKNTCDNIGSKLNLDTYYSGHGKCGWGQACSFQCGFIDSEGGTVIKDIP